METKLKHVQPGVVEPVEPGASQIWYRNPAEAFSSKTAHKFIPLRTMSLTDQLNSIFRLGLYYSLIMVLLSRSVGYLAVVLAVGIITAAVHELSSRESFTAVNAERGPLKTRCIIPTKRNCYDFDYVEHSFMIIGTYYVNCYKSLPTD